ncbi:MAG: hypothetical protein KBF83_14065, partial [Pyrinomonadaceae bacterium]|nr:hypothetical protein [Pyrinomonadaceae bacterium]
EMARWDEEIGRYELTTLADGVYVYKCRAADRPDELEIPLCVNCFGNRKRSVLQRGVKTIHGTAYDCPNCKTEITDHSDRSALQSSFRM